MTEAQRCALRIEFESRELAAALADGDIVEAMAHEQKIKLALDDFEAAVAKEMK